MTGFREAGFKPVTSHLWANQTNPCASRHSFSSITKHLLANKCFPCTESGKFRTGGARIEPITSRVLTNHANHVSLCEQKFLTKILKLDKKFRVSVKRKGSMRIDALRTSSSSSSSSTSSSSSSSSSSSTSPP